MAAIDKTVDELLKTPSSSQQADIAKIDWKELDIAFPSQEQFSSAVDRLKHVCLLTTVKGSKATASINLETTAYAFAYIFDVGLPQSETSSPFPLTVICSLQTLG